MRLRIKNAIEERLQVNPTKLGKPLSYKFKGYFRLHVGNYRIIYQVDTLECKVIIDTIKHRNNVYE